MLVVAAFTVVAGCTEAEKSGSQSDPSTDGGSGLGDESGETGEVEPLPDDADLQLETKDSKFFAFATCPAQDSAHIRVTMTAPPDMDIVSTRLRSFDFDDVLRRDDLAVAGVLPGSPRPESLAAGERGVFVFNVPVPDGPRICAPDSADLLGSTRATLELEVHGSELEVVGEVELWCAVEAPHTCT